MGTFRHSIEISDLDRRQSESIDAYVDTGAAFTVLPGNFLRDLGVQPIGQKRLLLADGSRVDMDYGRAWATVEGIDEITLVVFGETMDQPCWGPTHSKACPSPLIPSLNA